GPGFSTVEEALGSPENHTNLHNIVVVPIVIDEAFTDITYNDMGHFLAVTRTAMTLKGRHDNTSTQNGFSVRTNYPGGYRIEARNADGTGLPSTDPWLRPSRGSGAAGAAPASPVTEQVQAITSGTGKYKGYLEVRAGRLYTKVNVEQVWKLPLEYVAEFNLAGGSQYGSWPNNAAVTSAQTQSALRFANSHNNDQSGYYNWYVCTGTYDVTYNPGGKNLFSDPFFTTGAGKGYHLPSRQELTGVFSYGGQANYGSSVNHSNINEACEFGSVKKTFGADYTSTGNGNCYALRFKQGTGAPTGDTNSSLTDFPLAADNSMCCAYRYTRVGSFANNNNLTAQLKVECVFLGYSFTGDINTISNESWWNAQAAIPGNVVTRTFPATGHIYPAYVSGIGALAERGNNGDYWSNTYYNDDISKAWYANVGASGKAGANYQFPKFDGFAVRLFASE
ncbi:hypothetical protein ACMYZ5_07110, partial [Bacteroides sp. KG68]|uniref:hypothetical protein n=1 Tax=unclassified Bacteroides TaxID=2646097 RepID=UPI003D999C43